MVRRKYRVCDCHQCEKLPFADRAWLRFTKFPEDAVYYKRFPNWTRVLEDINEAGL